MGRKLFLGAGKRVNFLLPSMTEKQSFLVNQYSFLTKLPYVSHTNDLFKKIKIIFCWRLTLFQIQYSISLRFMSYSGSCMLQDQHDQAKFMLCSELTRRSANYRPQLGRILVKLDFTIYTLQLKLETRANIDCDLISWKSAKIFCCKWNTTLTQSTRILGPEYSLYITLWTRVVSKFSQFRWLALARFSLYVFASCPVPSEIDLPGLSQQFPLSFLGAVFCLSF